MTHSALLIAGGALLTSVLAALLFRPTASLEERHLRDVQRLMRALDAQRRVRDARRRRENRGRASRGPSHPPAIVKEQSRQEAEPPAQVAERNDRAERRAVEQLRRREKKEQAVALKAQRAVEKRARRELEQERKAALEAERARAEPQPQPAPAPASEVAEEPRRLTELPLYSWAARIETEDRVSDRRELTAETATEPACRLVRDPCASRVSSGLLALRALSMLMARATMGAN